MFRGFRALWVLKGLEFRAAELLSQVGTAKPKLFTPRFSCLQDVGSFEGQARIQEFVILASQDRRGRESFSEERRTRTFHE